MSTRALIGLFVAASTGIVIFLFVYLGGDGEGGSRVSVGARPAAAACKDPSKDCLPRLTFVDTNGTEYTPEQLAGKVVVVNFWATWCPPCQKEIPALSRVAERYKDRAIILGVLANDNPAPDQLLNYMSDHDMAYPVIRATPDIMLAFGYPGQLPTTFMYDPTGNPVMFQDRSGRPRREHLGELTETKLAAMIDRALRGGAP